MHGDTAPRLRPFLHIAREFYLTPMVLAFSLGLILLMVAADIAMPWMAKTAIDLITERNADAIVAAVFRQVVLICGTILAVALLQYLASMMLNRLYAKIVYRGTARLRETLYSRIQAQSLNFLAGRQIGEILTHLITDIHNLQDATLDLASEVPFDMCILLGLMAAMFVLNPTLALIVLLFLVGSAIFVYGVGRRGWQVQFSAMKGTADLTARMQEGFSAARTIATFDAAQGEEMRVQEASQRYTKHMETSGKLRAVMTPFLSFAEYAGVVTVLVIGGWEMLHGSLTAGGLVAFMAYMQLSADPISRFSRLVPRLQNATVSAARLHDLLAETRDAVDGSDALAPPDLTGELSIVNVSFCYPSAAVPALHGLNISVAAGEKVAIVGRNASGKSTFLDLLLRIQSPQQGRILVDGIDVSDIRLANWRSFIGVVPQDILLLNRSVAENIALGFAAPPQQIREAAIAAGLGEFIAGLPQGYETVVGERGMLLSGGERQRIAVARLFLRSPRIILLDEPTSALDIAYESALLPALRRLCADRTTFIVSHRLTVLTDVNKVLLMDGGRQLAFDIPTRVWRDFPAYRDLFPDSWRAHAEFGRVNSGSSRLLQP